MFGSAPTYDIDVWTFGGKWHHNSDLEGRIFLSAPNNHDRFFFLHTFRAPAFDF